MKPLGEKAAVADAPRISLIIPVFNQEKYIEECIASLLAQSMTDFEVIMVDDGSNDETFNIVGRMVDDDPRFKVITYERNKGTSQARKDAVLASSGDYIMFVDPDDSLNEHACRIALAGIEREGVDIFQFGTNVVNCGVNEGACVRFADHCAPYGERIERDTLFFACFEEKLFNFNLWNKIYNGNMVRLAFSFVKDGYYPKAQDMYAFVLMSYFSKSYASIKDELYNYNFGRGITGKRSISLDRFYKIATQMHIIEQLYKFIDDRSPTDICHYLNVISLRGKIFFNEVYANFTYVEDLEDNKDKAIEYFLEGMTPAERSWNYDSIQKRYLEDVFSYADELYYGKNLDYCQMVFDWAYGLACNHSDLKLGSFVYKEAERLSAIERTDKPVVPVVFATNNNYAPYLGATIASIIANASPEYVYDLYVFHTSLVEKHQLRLSAMSTDNVFIRMVNVVPYVKNMRNYSHSHYSVEMYYRILIPEILKRYDKAVYLDCDLVLTRDVAELYSTDVGENIVGAVINNIVSDYMKKYLESTLDIGLDEYFNSGVLVINNKAFIEAGIKDRCFELLNEFKKLTCPDQDILNLSCRGKVLYLPDFWNYQVGSGAFSIMQKYLDQHAVIHYTTGEKPWNTEGLELCEPFWRYAKLSPYYEDILSVYLTSTLKLDKLSRSEAGQPTGKHERNVINANHHKKTLISWPFRMMKAFFSTLSAYGFKYTMSKVKTKLKYVFGRIFGKVDKYNNPITKTKSKTPFVKEPVRNEEYYAALPVSKYDEELEVWYNKRTGSNMDITAPVTFNEKVQWLKIHDATLSKSHLSDKWLAKEYIAKVLGPEFIIKTLGVYERFEDINFDLLPDKFVIKSTHGSGHVIIVKDKSQLDLDMVKAKTEKWLSKTYGFACGFEVHYCNIIPRIIIEEFVEGIKDDLYDYKFMCMNGRVEFIWVDTDRFTDHRRNLYDRDWNLLSDKLHWPNSDNPIPKPAELEKLINLSEMLAKDFALVRCDFYILPDGEIKFGELTFTSASGIDKWNPEDANLRFGEKLSLPEPKPFKKYTKKEIMAAERDFIKRINEG